MIPNGGEEGHSPENGIRGAGRSRYVGIVTHRVGTVLALSGYLFPTRFEAFDNSGRQGSSAIPTAVRVPRIRPNAIRCREVIRVGKRGLFLALERDGQLGLESQGNCCNLENVTGLAIGSGLCEETPISLVTTHLGPTVGLGPDSRKESSMSTLKVLALLLAVLPTAIDYRHSVSGPTPSPPSFPASVSIAAQAGGDLGCHECYGECLYTFGGSCSPGRDGKFGLTECRTDIVPLDFGLVMCICDWKNGVICEASASLDGNERDTLIGDAKTVVASGGMLPADGLFYTARSPRGTVVRWKCNGALAARISV